MKVVNAIFCNDVRVESTGKHILIGVFLDNILFKEFPGKVSIAVWFQLELDRIGQFDTEFRFRKNGDMVAEGKGELLVESIKCPTTIFLPSISFTMESGGTLQFQFRESGKRWRTVKTIEVGLMEGAN